VTDAANVPRHRTIEQALRERIATLSPGDPLPSDAMLCAEFGVSRMTARAAMLRLADEGLVVRVPGRGSHVGRPPSHRRADRLLSFTAEMSRRGRRPTSRVLDREIRPARSDSAEVLGIRPGDPIVLLRRVRCADEEPIALETTRLIGAVSPAVMAADLSRQSLHAVLAAAGHTLRRGTATVEAAAATDEDARQLGIARGAPMLVERRVIADDHGRPIEETESRYPADRYAIDVRFDVEEALGAVVSPVPPR
jgi:GntR family transcriptional regulator